MTEIVTAVAEIVIATIAGGPATAPSRVVATAAAEIVTAAAEIAIVTVAAEVEIVKAAAEIVTATAVVKDGSKGIVSS